MTTTNLTITNGFRGLALCGLFGMLGGLGCSDDTAERPATFEAQVERGGQLFGDHCAHCHGDSGQGTSLAPAVVGEGALPLYPPAERQVRTSEFRTALDVFVFADANMPGDAPGSLPDDDLIDILAFALFANGVELDEPLSADNAASVVINAE
ncbi:MAG TPA: cytochrome c [Polyangiaceae bacterium]|nr:cytochrome c [Polyangiaceae bacterium]